MTSNPYLKRLLGEAVEPDIDPEAEPAAEPAAERPPAAPPSEPGIDKGQPSIEAPNTQELIQQWQAGMHMAVAARLMFTEYSYTDFVDLLFVLGQEEGRELGQLLDELADTEEITPPETPPQYFSALRHAGNASEEDVL